MIDGKVANLPVHASVELVVNFDIYHPATNGEEMFERWRILRRGDQAPLRWTSRNGGHWIAVDADDDGPTSLQGLKQLPR